MKKILLLLITFLSVFCLGHLNVNATSNSVLDYNIDSYFRGVWVTPKDSGNIGNIKPTSTKTKEQKIADYKLEVTRILDIMEYYNLNALIFHIRVDNDAIYYSDINPWSSWFTTYGVDPGWDPLKWVIEETHKRGIEFHAWMNPYRIHATGETGTTAEDVAKGIPSYNIGSDPKNILVSSENYGSILNPGLPEVREFIIDTCMEVIEKYDVDAIHFDDYFYVENVNDDDTYAKYNPKGLSHDDWRRDQVDIFIEDLSKAMRKYNEENNRYVQLGISPSGVWKSDFSNGGKVTYDVNGTAITNGSATTTTFQHYGSYLYSDTKKWCDEEWIDYILPQTYWGISHPSAAFKPLIDWWDAIVKYKKVNLYSGMGIYMSAEAGKYYSWGSDSNEAYNQITYCYDLDNTYGTVFYNFTYLKDAYYGKTESLYGKGMTKVKNELFTIPAVLPEVRTMERVVLPAPTNFNVKIENDNTTLTFDEVENTKFYVIYRSNDEINFSSNQVYKIISRDSNNGKVIFVDKNTNGKKYCYGVKALSGTNTLGSGATLNSSFRVTFKDWEGTVLKEETVSHGGNATAPTPNGKTGATFIGWSKDITNITSDLEVIAKYSDSEFIVKFYDINGNVIKTEKLKYLENATAPDPNIEGYDFISWSEDFTKVSEDLDIYPNYNIKYYNVVFKYVNPLTEEEITLKEQTVAYNEGIAAPEYEEFKGYTFNGWSEDFTKITKDLVIYAKYESIYFTVTFINDEDESVIDVQKVRYGENATYPEIPEVKGMEFSRWRGPVDNITSDRIIRAIYAIAEYTVIFKDWDGKVLLELETFYEDEFDAPNNPSREGYTFLGWDKDFSEVTSDLVITALYRKNIITVSYIDANGNVLNSSEVENFGQDIIADYEAPILNGYTFSEWKKEITENDDINFIATYEKENTTISCKSASVTSILNSLLVIGVLLILKKRNKF